MRRVEGTHDMFFLRACVVGEGFLKRAAAPVAERECKEPCAGCVPSIRLVNI